MSRGGNGIECDASGGCVNVDCKNETLLDVYMVPLILKLVSNFAALCVVGGEESKTYAIAPLHLPLSHREGKYEYGSSGRLEEQAEVERMLVDHHIVFEGAMEIICNGTHWTEYGIRILMAHRRY